MANQAKELLLRELEKEYGEISRFANGSSLFTIGDNAAKLYFRYSKTHNGRRAFFGLREIDLRQLQGHNSFICLLTDGTLPPIFLPYADFEDAFKEASPAADGQYKVQLIDTAGQLELYIAGLGRFNVEGFVGTSTISQRVSKDHILAHRELSHPQVQTLLAGIGHLKGLDVYVPAADRQRLDWNLTNRFRLTAELPQIVRPIASEIDVVWLVAGRSRVHSLFEVEHTTTIYSGLLRLNDALLAEGDQPKFIIVADEARRSLVVRQATRPTFTRSGLAELVSFLEYRNVYDWHARLSGKSLSATSGL